MEVLYIVFYKVNTNDFNSRFIQELVKRKIRVTFVNFEEYVNKSYILQFDSNFVSFSLIHKCMISNQCLRHFRKIINTITMIYHIWSNLAFEKKFKRIVAVDYICNLVVFVFEKLFCIEKKRIYVLQELYQYDNYPIKYSKVKISIDRASQNNSILTLNRNVLRYEFVNKINPKNKFKHEVLMDIANINTNKEKCLNHTTTFNMIYAGSCERDGLLDLIVNVLYIFTKEKINIKLFIFGLSEKNLESWKSTLLKAYNGSFFNKVDLNLKIENNKLLSVYQSMHAGLVYYPYRNTKRINDRLAAPCKIFELIGYNLPIISYGSLYCDELIKEFKIGISFNKREIQKQVSDFYLNYSYYLENVMKLNKENRFSFPNSFKEVESYLV